MPDSTLHTVKTAPFATESGAGGGGGPSASRRPNHQYDLSDIERAQPTPYLSRLNGGRDPLMPVYKLAAVVERPATPPRFVRDAIDVRDIARAQPRDAFAHWATKPQSSLQTADISGASPVARYASTARQNSSLEAKDITHTRFISQRHSDPNDPVYTFGRTTSLDVSSQLGRLYHQQQGRGEEEKTNSIGESTLTTHGPILGGKPRGLPPARQPDNVLNLRTWDVCSPEAREWSWKKPKRTLVSDTTNTRDIPGAQSLADRARILKTTRHIDPNERNYSDAGLGGALVDTHAGMVHVHRHVLDNTPAAITWKPQFGEPSEDAAGLSIWRNGNFTAGMQPPRKAAAPAAASIAAPKKAAFGAPAEHESDRPVPMQRVATPTIRAAPAAQQQQQQHEQPARSAARFDDAPAESSVPEPAARSSAASTHTASSSASTAAASSVALSSTTLARAHDPAFLSHPANARKQPMAQRRHNAAASALHARRGSNLLVDPASNGREFVAVDAARRLPTMSFGTRGPYAVPTEKASIEETRVASQPSSVTASRSNSRPQSRSQMQPGGGLGGDASASSPTSKRMASMSAFTPTASTLSNAFSLAFVPTSTTTLPASLPYSSPVSRPGLGTREFFERTGIQGGQGAGPTRGLAAMQKGFGGGQTASWTRVQEKKTQTIKQQEMQQVRALA